MSHTSSIHVTDGCLHVKNLHVTQTTDYLVAIYRSVEKMRQRGRVYADDISHTKYMCCFMCLVSGYLLMVIFTSKTYPRFYRIGGLDTFVFLIVSRLPNVIGFVHLLSFLEKRM
jgi:hypothetical protein